MVCLVVFVICIATFFIYHTIATINSLIPSRPSIHAEIVNICDT